ncbi:MAG: glycosyltransferase family 2 protein, partial [Pyrinomonadaceae bacterium]|nr:glycosyltransferase family 2 protein [Pyrinomonadaceae bacterium]
NFSAVSSACLAIRSEVFDEVSGFYAENLPNGLFDADLCLRIGEKGYRIVWTPHAECVQIVDSATEKAVSRNSPETVYFKRRYEKILKNDLFYNPNLSLDDENFSVAIPPRFEKVWRKS